MSVCVSAVASPIRTPSRCRRRTRRTFMQRDAMQNHMLTVRTMRGARSETPFCRALPWPRRAQLWQG